MWSLERRWFWRCSERDILLLNYEANVRIAWHVLPCSAMIELLVVSLFAANLALPSLQPPAHFAASGLRSKRARRSYSSMVRTWVLLTARNTCIGSAR